MKNNTNVMNKKKVMNKKGMDMEEVVKFGIIAIFTAILVLGVIFLFKRFGAAGS